MAERAVRFAEGFYRDRPGEAVVVGLRGEEPALAFAAGLRTEPHKAHLATLARYLFARHSVDGYLVILPADLDEREVVAVEYRSPPAHALYAARVRRGGSGQIDGIEPPRPLDGQTALVGDLLARGQALPGIMRRKLDQAYETLRIDFPAAG
jgi:hypothetical protein